MQDSGRWSLPEQVCVDMGRLLVRLYFRFRVEGSDHIPRRGGALVICNHPSYLEPMLVTLALPRPASHLAMRMPWRYPSAGYFLDLFGCIPIDPNESAVSAIRKMTAAVNQGRLLVVFPEGRLSDRGMMRRFHPGAARVALETHCPVIPAAVSGSYAAMPQGAMFIKPRPVLVRFGPPLNLRKAYGRRRNTRLIKAMTHDMEQAVARLYDGPTLRPRG